jgi:putative transcriptional regulator
MAVKYNKLWKILIDKNLKRTDLKNIAGISTSTIAKLGKGEYVSMECLDRICKSLKVDVGDVMDFVTDEATIKENK